MAGGRENLADMKKRAFVKRSLLAVAAGATVAIVLEGCVGESCTGICGTSFPSDAGGSGTPNADMQDAGAGAGTGGAIGSNAGNAGAIAGGGLAGSHAGGSGGSTP
jgi:hypothetical protein